MKIFQSQTLSINDFLSCIQTCISSLESLYAGNDMGVYLADLYATFNVLEKSWKNYSFDFNENDKTTMHDLALKTAKKVAEDVKEHFPDNQILNNMKVLEIPYLKSILKPLPKDQISAVGNQELETLIKYYNTFLTNRNNGLSVNVAELKPDKTECLGEWRELKINIKDHLLIEEPEIRQKIMSRLHYPNLHLIYHFMSVIPLSTTECERTFSSMNLIKTEQRNQMNHDTLDYHMLISLLGPSENEYIESICKNALELRKNSRKRYNL